MAAVGVASTDMRAGSMQCTTPVHRYAEDGGARSDGGDGGRTAPPAYVHASGWDDSFSNLAEAHHVV